MSDANLLQQVGFPGEVEVILNCIVVLSRGLPARYYHTPAVFSFTTLCIVVVLVITLLYVRLA